jgi:hypothetical protein
MSCVRMERKSLKVLILISARCACNNYVCQGEFCAVWEELDYQFDICRVTRGAHIECF